MLRHAGIREGLPQDIAAHLNLRPGEAEALIDGHSDRLRQLCLVDAVAHYEAFLEVRLRSELMMLPLPKDKKPRMEIPFGEVSAGETAEQFVRRFWAAYRTAEVIGKGYRERPSSLDNALGIDICTGGSEHGLDLDMLHVAMLFRNCVVHAGGVVDSRTYEEASAVVPGLIVGAKLPIDEPMYLRMLEALYAHAQDVDLLLRVRRVRTLKRERREKRATPQQPPISRKDKKIARDMVAPRRQRTSKP